jgi:Domain of unknown function (DUF4835)
MLHKIISLFCISLLLQLKCISQELNATITLQTSKVDNQVDPKTFVQLQSQLKDFLNQRKWTSDAYSNEEKIDCNFYITIESVVSLGVYDAKLSVVSNRPVYNSAYTTPLLNMQDANFTFKYQLSQPIEFNENRVQGADALEANLTATLAYYIYVILGLDYDSYALQGGKTYFNKALNIVNNAPEGSGITGWKSYDGQRNRYLLIDNFTQSGFDKLHNVLYSYYREGLDQLVDKPSVAKAAILNALMSMQEVYEAGSNTMAVPILMQGKVTEIIGIFGTADKSMKKQLIATLSTIDIANINKYKEKLE